MTAVSESLAGLRVEPMVLPVDGLSVEFESDPKACKSRTALDRNTRILLPDGRKMRVSDRFWNSWSSLFNLSRSTFDYFSHEEVFKRLAGVRQDRVRVTAQLDGASGATGTLLSCTNPAKPLLPVDEIRSLTDRYAGRGLAYSDGVVTASFDCPFPLDFEI